VWLVILIVAIVFGSGAFTATADQVASRVAMQVGIPELFTIESEPVTTLGIEPVSGEARYAATASNTWSLAETGGWQRSGPPPGREMMVLDSRDELVLWAGSGVDCYRGLDAPLPMMQSSDGGATWVEGGPEGAVPLASWLSTGIVVGHDCSGLLVSTDSGATWAVPEGLPLGSQITAFAVGSTPESAAGLTLLVGVTGEGGTSQLYRVGVSGFEAPSVDGPLQTYYAIGAVGVLDEGAYLLGSAQGVMRSDDRGETWSTFRGGLESTTLELDPLETFPADLEPGSFGLRSMLTPGDQVFLTGVDGIYRWSDAAFSWTLVAPLEAEVNVLAVEPGSGALVMQTVDGDILRFPVE
jgi:hypothetical protein